MMTTHVFVKHAPGQCDYNSCPICDGGLALCSLCGGGEGSLPTDCPGAMMTWEQSMAVYAGDLDYRAGEWRVGQDWRGSEEDS